MAPMRTGTSWRRAGPLERSQRRPIVMTRSAAPIENPTRWIVSITRAAFASARKASTLRLLQLTTEGGHADAAGSQNRSQRNSSGIVTTRKIPTIPRSLREVRRPVGNASRNAANEAAHRSVSQIPTVNTTGFGTRVIVRPSSHSIPTSVISGPSRLAGRRVHR